MFCGVMGQRTSVLEVRSPLKLSAVLLHLYCPVSAAITQHRKFSQSLSLLSTSQKVEGNMDLVHTLFGLVPFKTHAESSLDEMTLYADNIFHACLIPCPL